MLAMQRTAKPRVRSVAAGVVTLAVAVAAWLIPGTAFAKGDLQATTARLAITGPGLAAPIVLTWRGSCFMLAQFACSQRYGTYRESQRFPKDLGQVHGAFWRLANDSNFLLQAAASRSRGYKPTDGAAMGPKYQVTWVVTRSGHTDIVRQDLYPFGPPMAAGLNLPGVPWLFTPDGQSVFDQMIGWGWMPTMPNFFDDMVARGLPPVAPDVPEAPAPVASAPAAQPAPVPAPEHAASRAPADHSIPAWPIGVGVVMLLVFVALGAVAGRPGRRTGRVAAAT